MENLTRQVFKDFEWVIVNDGGDKESTQNIVDAAIAHQLQAKLVNNVSSQGRSKAANIGVDNAAGKYVLILDDDDYTHEQYFQKVYDFFESSPQYSAVTCWSDIMLEEMSKTSIINHGVCGRYAPDMNALSIINLHTHNIPTCGLTVRRDTFLSVGGYPLGIDCSEDWSFVCRVIIETNIGVIPEVLAYISRRVNPTGFYTNTTVDISGVQKHKEHEIIWKNDRVRESLKANNLSGLAILFGNMNLQMQEIADSMRRIESIIARIKSMLNKVHKLSGVYYIQLFIRTVKKVVKNAWNFKIISRR
jgi:glycosyltransferase involved in cell wall biosynthesis